jgi:two-component system, chemotaxis family, chemotaxis protein CheY
MPSCLIVDDNPNNRLVARYIMEDLHFTVVEVSSADAAGAALLEQPIDVMILDWMMPQMDGIDFLTRLRQNPANASLKVVMCTAKGGEASVATAMQAGANAYLPKPITFDDAQKVMQDLGLLL